MIAYVPKADHTDAERAIAGLRGGRPVAWISAEGPGVLEAVTALDASRGAGDPRSALAVTRFEVGRAAGTHLLGRCDPHGATLEGLAG